MAIELPEHDDRELRMARTNHHNDEMKALMSSETISKPNNENAKDGLYTRCYKL